MPSISTEIAERQRAHPDRRARVRAALRAEDLDQQVRGAVRDLVLLLELGVRVDQHEQLHDARDAVELADLGLQAREQVDDRQLRPPAGPSATSTSRPSLPLKT